MNAQKIKNDTIAARATAAGPAGIGIIRISGPAVPAIAEIVLGKIPLPRYATYFPFKNKKGLILDEGVALYFKAPNSFTGEDVLELQGHGGTVVLNSVLNSVLEAGARLARPGEFSERAFLNGKIDLLQAEAIAGLIEASSEQAAQSAIRSLQGEFSKEIHKLRDLLIQLHMRIEAEIDFPEEDVPVTDKEGIQKKLISIYHHIQTIQNRAKQGALIGEGLNVALIGEVNAGKSSLLNYFSGEERAIVTDIEGTTRDIIRETIVLDGIPIHLFDTAGIRETVNPIEQEGINRAKKLAKDADLILYMVDASKKINYKKIWEKANQINNFSEKCIIVRNKIDITQEAPGFIESKELSIINISVKKEKGFSELKKYITEKAVIISLEETAIFSRKRHVVAIQEIKEILEKTIENFNKNSSLEFLSEDLRVAQRKLSEILGEFTADDLLGKIFSEFCIGK